MLSYADAKNRAIAASDFCADNYQRFAEAVSALENSNQFYLQASDDFSTLKEACSTAEDEMAFRAAIRRWRNLHMLRIAVSDITGACDIETILRKLSELADAAIELALDWERGRLEEKHGKAFSRSGQQQQLYVLGMGKLGGFELNFSSDIDLIFLYPEPGNTDGPRQLSNQEFFTKLAQKVSGHLNAVTADGFVYRVDTRLRPFGDSGPLVMHSQQALDYYEKHGREWERYAMIKARVCAGDLTAGQAFLDDLQPFVYRRYIDFTAVNGLRQMKRMIEAQYTAENLQQNIKLGPGGIREVEFVAQLFQLMRGGRHQSLRSAELLPVLNALGQLALIPASQVEALTADYYLLRRFENRLQQFRDQQTHQLPSDEDEDSWARLAASLNYENDARCRQALADARQRVHTVFSQLFSEDVSDQAEITLEPMAEGSGCHAEVIQRQLDAAGYTNEGLVRRALAICNGHSARGFSDDNRRLLFKLVSALLVECLARENPERALARAFDVLEGIGQRAAYIALLAEYPDARSQLIALCDASPWITHQLARFPLLLDELLDPRVLDGVVDRDSLRDELQSRLDELDADDLEQQMEVLRQFKNAAVLRVAAADINHHLPLMRVSDCLTELAEVILNAAVKLATDEMQRRYGRPMYGLAGEQQEAELLVIAYGKLGGIELGYGSDLDIVFLHTSRGDKQLTDGAKPQSNGVYFSRVVQRVMHLLQTVTPSGRLYEVDTRLRPNGASGMPVIGLDAYAKYLSESAWTWELQALVRARLVVGSKDGRQAYKEVREYRLAQPRDTKALAVEVQEMKAKMAKHLDNSAVGEFNLKYGAGGLVDIEFFVQYLVLANAHSDCRWGAYSDNVRIIRCAVEVGLLESAEAELLIRAYIELRCLSHSLALQELSKNLDQRPKAALTVTALLDEYFPANPKD